MTDYHSNENVLWLHLVARGTISSTDLPTSTLLLASLQPSTRKQAKSNLNELSLQPGFITALLRLVLETTTQDRRVRLAGSVFLKNVTKLRWEEVSSVCVWFGCKGDC